MGGKDMSNKWLKPKYEILLSRDEYSEKQDSQMRYFTKFCQNILLIWLKGIKVKECGE